jgi:hypothetical protein
MTICSTPTMRDVSLTWGEAGSFCICLILLGDEDSSEFVLDETYLIIFSNYYN